MFLMDPGGDDGGPAADTGSAMHKAIAMLHKGSTVAESLVIMQERIAEYPLADLQDAAAMFLRYSVDPRNTNAEIVLIEEPVKFQIAPAPEDPTGEPIEVEGTLDQVRREHGKLRLWDPKSSKKDPMQLMFNHMYQLAGYCIGASFKLGETVHPGGLILTRMYEKNKNPHWQVAWTFDDIEQILDPLRHVVALIRSGRPYHVPNENCTYCPQRSPDLCIHPLKVLRRGAN